MMMVMLGKLLFKKIATGETSQDITSFTIINSFTIITFFTMVNFYNNKKTFFKFQKGADGRTDIRTHRLDPWDTWVQYKYKYNKLASSKMRKLKTGKLAS